MSKPRINKIKAKKIILSKMEEGLTFNDTYAAICRNMQLSERAFANYWKECQQEYKERQNRLEKEKDDVRVEMEKEAVKYDILSRYERQEIATKIARNNPKRIPTKLDANGNPIEYSLVYNSAAEVVRALDYLSKIDGDYAPEKQELEHKYSKDTIQHIRDALGIGDRKRV